MLIAYYKNCIFHEVSNYIIMNEGIVCLCNFKVSKRCLSGKLFQVVLHIPRKILCRVRNFFYFILPSGVTLLMQKILTITVTNEHIACKLQLLMKDMHLVLPMQMHLTDLIFTFLITT